jgi:outer membrane protein
MRRILALLLLAALPAAAEDLLAVYAQARAADPQLAQAAAEHGVQQELATQARSVLLPQWSLSASDARSQADGSRARDVASNISQTVFDLASLHRWDAARTALSAQEARLRAAEQDLCARVARAYFGVLLAQAGLATAQADEAVYAEQVRQAEARQAAGLAAAVDADQARTYYELARGTTVQAAQGLDDAKQALAQITGRAPGVLAPLAAALPVRGPEPDDAADWLERALAANPQVLAQQLELAAGEQRIDAARAAHAPTLSLGLDSERATAFNGAATTLALRLKWPLFAGGATESLVRQAAFQRDAQREALESTRRAALREVQLEFQAVRSGVLLVQSTRAAVDAAGRALAATRAGQALGTRTMTDLLLAIQTQAAAQNAHEQARHGYVLATLLLQQAAGSLGEAELATVNRLLQGER